VAAPAIDLSWWSELQAVQLAVPTTVAYAQRAEYLVLCGRLLAQACDRQSLVTSGGFSGVFWYLGCCLCCNQSGGHEGDERSQTYAEHGLRREPAS
jgi:hypothetical protein